VKLRERIAGLDAELSQLEATKNLLSVDLESSRGEVMHGQTDKQAREERVALLQAELESLTTKSEATRAEATALKVKVASSSERGSSARQRADALFTQVNELTERAGRLSTTKEEGAARIAELEQRLSETGAGREEREAKLAEARGGIDARKEAHAAEVAKVRDEEHQLKELRASAEGLTHELAELTLKSRELSLELEHLSSTVQERHGVAMHEAISLYHTHPQLGAEAVERLKELRAQVEKMGEVNVTAIEEHEEIAQRFEFLSKQKKDLEASLAQLTEAIKTIDETSRQRFKETFDVVNDKFQQVFPRLFGGGRASLLLTQEPGSNEPGIEILAQPPGKKLQSVNLFSGGEKALTAVALIFGIFLIKPTPFCLLDEVDAPLDEGNVGRYNDMVKEMSKTSQFILITHNKRTMEIGDTLYGVTMEEPGVSKLVAVNLKEAAANSDQQVA
jgi:chromosome segregation protein